MKPFVFLDIDGVLNSHHYMTRTRRKPDGSLYSIYDADTWEEMLDPKCVARLSRIVAETGAITVISSSWRHVHPTHKIKSFLRARGFTGRIAGATPTLAGRCRGEEIRLWLLTHTQWGRPDVGLRVVVLDDNSDMGPMMPYFVKTSLTTGLTDEDADRAIAILRGPEPTRGREIRLEACAQDNCPVCLHPAILRAAERAVRSCDKYRAVHERPRTTA